jgi:hypothetical protein
MDYELRQAQQLLNSNSRHSFLVGVWLSLRIPSMLSPIPRYGLLAFAAAWHAAPHLKATCPWRCGIANTCSKPGQPAPSRCVLAKLAVLPVVILQDQPMRSHLLPTREPNLRRYLVSARRLHFREAQRPNRVGTLAEVERLTQTLG